ncbi:hypothetical protein S225a_22690 [Candidatus Brocadiaceae bacterium S225]|uniref:Uncharacterized protein n=1 Tax=Candidatus Scalindua brodae TaxID=237368 RepID=A0A0B0EKX2_9BACT|nr:MAG: hypothetical protein SCABRO_00991 [Candidatus Scalindua brodae]TWU31047.1 hypothetical protein S225a_22690 [Candidatus Brocadiaceae bacterium S225]
MADVDASRKRGWESIRVKNEARICFSYMK